MWVNTTLIEQAAIPSRAAVPGPRKGGVGVVEALERPDAPAWCDAKTLGLATGMLSETATDAEIDAAVTVLIQYIAAKLDLLPVWHSGAVCWPSGLLLERWRAAHLERLREKHLEQLTTR